MIADLGRRPFRPDDLPFLEALYASTRRDELAPLPWPESRKAAFLRQQFDAQRRHYEAHFADADYGILTAGDQPIGRLIVARSPDERRIIDIALIPERRGQGIGTALLTEILVEAQTAGVPVRLHVEHNNPARRLYDRLGFVPAGESGPYVLLERR